MSYWIHLARKRGARAMASTPKKIAEGFAFLEGARWWRGRLYASDFYLRRVVAIDARGEVEVICETPDQPSGLGFLPNGDMIISSMMDRRLLRFSAGRLQVHADLSEFAQGWCNDL